MDKYLTHVSVVDRLVEEWTTHRDKFIIAFDYDDTVFDYNKSGHTYDKVIGLLHRCQNIGAYFICFSCSQPQRYPEMREYLDSRNIPVDTINGDGPHATRTDDRKPQFNILLDDRAGLSESVFILDTVCDIMEAQ